MQQQPTHSPDTSADLNSLAQKLQQISLDQTWVSRIEQVPSSYFECPVCLFHIFEPVQCQKCQRLFCETDYVSCKAAKDACPLCKASPWEIKQTIHISYRIMQQSMQFKCNKCEDGKRYTSEELKLHLRTHGMKIRQHRMVFYRYIVVQKGAEYPLSHLQNLEINYKARMGCRKFKVLDSERGELRLDLDKSLVYYKMQGIKFECELIGKQMEAEEVRKINTLWTFYNQEPLYQFYTEDHQKVLEQGYQQYVRDSSQSLVSICSEATDTKYSVSFDQMKQTNIKTGFEREIERIALKLKGL